MKEIGGRCGGRKVGGGSGGSGGVDLKDLVMIGRKDKMHLQGRRSAEEISCWSALGSQSDGNQRDDGVVLDH